MSELQQDRRLRSVVFILLLSTTGCTSTALRPAFGTADAARRREAVRPVSQSDPTSSNASQSLRSLTPKTVQPVIAPAVAEAHVTSAASADEEADIQLLAAEMRMHADERAAADQRIASLERQLKWSQDDVARMREMINQSDRSKTEATKSQSELEIRQTSMQQSVTELQVALENANRTSASQQATMEALSRRVAELETTLVDEHAKEVRALDGVIEGLEQLLKFEAEKTIRQGGPHKEAANASR